MKRIRSAALLAGVVASISSGTALAADPAEADASSRAAHAYADRGWDENMTREKLVKRAHRQFDAMDQDGDGVVSRKEARQWGQKAREKRELRDGGEYRKERKEKYMERSSADGFKHRPQQQEKQWRDLNEQKAQRLYESPGQPRSTQVLP